LRQYHRRAHASPGTKVRGLRRRRIRIGFMSRLWRGTLCVSIKTSPGLFFVENPEWSLLPGDLRQGADVGRPIQRRSVPELFFRAKLGSLADGSDTKSE